MLNMRKRAAVKSGKPKPRKAIDIWNLDHTEEDEEIGIRELAIRDADRAFEKHVKELKQHSK